MRASRGWYIFLISSGEVKGLMPMTISLLPLMEHMLYWMFSHMELILSQQVSSVSVCFWCWVISAMES